MDAALLIVASVAGLAGLLLVADMIVADLRNQQRERIAVRSSIRPADKARAAVGARGGGSHR